MSSRTDFDAIVIGSGMGGLAFASIMAKLRHWRVLVLERHFKIGGFTHTFTRPGGWSWDVGLHYVGEMGEGMMGRRLFDFITGGRVQWNPLPHVYDVFVYPNLQVKAGKGEAKLRSALIEAFPQERSNIEHYLRDLSSATGWTSRYFAAMATPAPVSWLLRAVNRCTSGLPLQVTRQYLERRFRDPQLRAVVTSQWADYGVPPGQSAFATHALIASHYLNGAWYPAGGAGEIAKGTSIEIRAAGGELLPNHEVTRIILEGDRAVGVAVNVSKGKQGSHAEFRAPVVISDAGAWNTFTRMLPASALPFRDELKSPPEGFEVIELFLGLRRDPREMGFRGENYWIFGSSDHDEMYARRSELLDGRAQMAYLSFPSLKDPQAQRHTAEIIAPFDYRALEAHRGEPWRRRSAVYDSAKDRMTQALLNLVERHHPGFRDLVEYSELATPLTFEHFTAAPSGTIYGYPGTPEKYSTAWLGPRTPVGNLYLTGSDAAFLGIMGAMMGGVLTASCLLGRFGFLEVMRAARSNSESRVPVSAERITPRFSRGRLAHSVSYSRRGGCTVNNKVIMGAIALAAMFLVGFVPQYVKASRLETELRQARQENAGAQLRDLISLAYVQANRKNFGLAADTSTRFFGSAREMADQAKDANSRKALEDLLAPRDKVTAELAKGDAAAMGDLQELFDKTRQATGNSSNP